MIITLDEILREQERILRKQSEEQAALLGENKSQNGHSNDPQLIPSDESPKKKAKSRSPTKSKKQLTLHDMKFAKNSDSNSHNQLIKKSSSTTMTVAVPYSLLQKLDKTRRDRGIDSRGFQRLVLHLCTNIK